MNEQEDDDYFDDHGYLPFYRAPIGERPDGSIGLLPEEAPSDDDGGFLTDDDAVEDIIF